MDASVESVIHSRAQRRAMRRDLQRYIRVVRSFDFSGVAENSPVEITEGYVVSDKETDEVFVCFELLCVAARPLRSLTIRLHLYDRQNVPYEKLTFRYSAADGTLGLRSGLGKKWSCLRAEPVLIRPGEAFGRASYIRLPGPLFQAADAGVGFGRLCRRDRGSTRHCRLGRRAAAERDGYLHPPCVRE